MCIRDRDIIDARSTADQEYRKSVYKQCLDIILDWAVEIPIYQRQNCVIYSPERINADTFTVSYTHLMTSIRFSWAMRDLVTLLCIGIALAPAFKMRFWNIGAEGQVLIGGLATAMVMVKCGQNLPTPVLFLVMFLTSIIAGGLWGFIPAIFKAYWNTNETLFTLMMNYVATSIVACMTNILRGKASSLGKLNMSTQAGWFPQFLGQRYNCLLYTSRCV